MLSVSPLVKVLSPDSDPRSDPGMLTLFGDVIEFLTVEAPWLTLGYGILS